MAQIAFKTIKEPKAEVRHNMKGLTERDMRAINYDQAEKRFDNVGFVGIDGTAHKSYVFILESQLLPEFCSRHFTEMSRKTVMKSGGFFKRTTLYYQCDEVIGPDFPCGKRNLCHDNLYPMYPRQQLQRESIGADPELHPVIFERV